MRIGAGEIGEFGKLGMIKPCFEGEIQRRQPCKPGPPGRIEHLTLDGIGARLRECVACVPSDGMTNAAKAAVSSRDLSLQHPRHTVTEPQIGMPDDASA